jgi:peptidoglycan/LPS O-acetylase OafA/YrhL
MAGADRFYMLDGMRGTAFIPVVLFHLGLVAEH